MPSHGVFQNFQNQSLLKSAMKTPFSKNTSPDVKNGCLSEVLGHSQNPHRWLLPHIQTHSYLNVLCFCLLTTSVTAVRPIKMTVLALEIFVISMVTAVNQGHGLSPPSFFSILQVEFHGTRFYSSCVQFQF